MIFDGELVNPRDREQLYRLRRRLGMLFQHGALFSAFSVLDNIAFPMRELQTLPEDLVRDAALVKLQMVAVTAIQPERVEDGTSVNADCRTQVRLR